MNAGRKEPPSHDWTHDLVLPTLLFAALGAMTWAVRGCAGAGGMNAHVAPGLTWGAAWWFLARADAKGPARRYTSGWILLALAAGFAIAGERGWMQWPNFFNGHLATNYAKGEFVPLSRAYGFLWFFIAGTAWAGLPACFLAWCASGQPRRAWDWTLRIACGFGGACLAWLIFAAHPQVFLPLHDIIQAKYADFQANPNLAKLYRDNGASLRHLGFYLGFLAYEIARRDWRNVKLILAVGLVTGAGWAACQNWQWAFRVWPGASFNFGRCWEASGGVCIGLGFGLAYYLANRPAPPRDPASAAPMPPDRPQTGQWLLACALLVSIGATTLWPAPRDLRRPIGLAVPGPHYLASVLYLAAAVMCGGIAIRQRARARRLPDATAERPPSLLRRGPGWGALALMLVLGWFVKTQMASEYGDGVADGALAGWLGPGSLYFAIVAAYVAAQVLRPRPESDRQPSPPTPADAGIYERRGPDRDWLATYLGLSIIALWCLSVGLTNAWHAPLFLGIVVAAFGVALHSLAHRSETAWFPTRAGSVLDRWGLWLGLVYGLGLSLRRGLKGGANLYVGNEDAWDNLFWNWVPLGMLACLVAGAVWVLKQPKQPPPARNGPPNAYSIIWLVLLAQNLLAQVVTGPLWGPHASWTEFAFNLFYVILFVLTAVIVFHCHILCQRRSEFGLYSSHL